MAHRTPASVATSRPSPNPDAAGPVGPVDTVLGQALSRLSEPLAEPCTRIVLSPGRRLRPALVLRCAAAGGASARDREATMLAAAVELLHCATLVHDDVIDGATTRRGVATINAREGLSTAIVCGDALISTAMALAADVSSSAAAVMAQTLADLCAGQAREESLRFQPKATREQAREVAAGKTGSLLRAACLLGAEAAELDEDLARALGRYGTAFGVCLQLVDDVLDVASTSARLGKPVGGDLAAGVMTDVVVNAVRRHPELSGLLGAPAGSPDHGQALLLVRVSGAVGVTIDAARSLGLAAGAALATAVPDDALLLELSTWAARYVDTQLRDKVDPDLVADGLPWDRPAERSAARR